MISDTTSVFKACGFIDITSIHPTLHFVHVTFFAKSLVMGAPVYLNNDVEYEQVRLENATLQIYSNGHVNAFFSRWSAWEIWRLLSSYFQDIVDFRYHQIEFELDLSEFGLTAWEVFDFLLVLAELGICKVVLLSHPDKKKQRGLDHNSLIGFLFNVDGIKLIVKVYAEKLEVMWFRRRKVHVVYSNDILLLRQIFALLLKGDKDKAKELAKYLRIFEYEIKNEDVNLKKLRRIAKELMWLSMNPFINILCYILQRYATFELYKIAKHFFSQDAYKLFPFVAKLSKQLLELSYNINIIKKDLLTKLKAPRHISDMYLKYLEKTGFFKVISNRPKVLAFSSRSSYIFLNYMRKRAWNYANGLESLLPLRYAWYIDKLILAALMNIEKAMKSKKTCLVKNIFKYAFGAAQKSIIHYINYLTNLASKKIRLDEKYLIQLEHDIIDIKERIYTRTFHPAGKKTACVPVVRTSPLKIQSALELFINENEQETIAF